MSANKSFQRIHSTNIHYINKHLFWRFIMNNLTTFTAPVGRILLSIMFISSGLNKINQFEGTQGYMDAMGVPSALLPLVILTEVLGGLAILLGWKARYAACALAGFCVLTAILFHSDFANQMEMINFMKNMAIAGGFLLIVAHGAGAYSIDNWKKANSNSTKV